MTSEIFYDPPTSSKELALERTGSLKREDVKSKQGKQGSKVGGVILHQQLEEMAKSCDAT